jgi:hypothetical protein
VRTAPRLLPPFAFVGPLTTTQPSGTGIVLALAVVAAGGSLTVTHGLGRVPVYAAVLVNGTPDYPGGCYIVSATATTAVLKFERAQTATSFAYVT